MIRKIALAVVTLSVVAIDSLSFRKLLVECLPYKEMTQPPWTFYASVGEHAWLIILACSVPFIWLLRRRAHLIPLAVAVIAPVSITLILVIGGVSCGTSRGYASNLTPAAATFDFMLFGGFLACVVACVPAVIAAATRPRSASP